MKFDATRHGHRLALLGALILPLAAHAQGHGAHGGHAGHAAHAAHGAQGGHAAHAATAPMPTFEQMQAAPRASAEVTGCWIRGMPARLPSAAYFVLENRGASALALTGVAARDYGEAMLHTTRDNAQGMAEMVHVDRVDVPPGERAVFEPGGRHVMLMAPRAEARRGETVPLALWTEGGQAVMADCEVRSATGR